MSERIPTINALDFPSPLACVHEVVLHGNPSPPVWIKCGLERFKLTKENGNTFMLAVMFATAPEWKRAAAKQVQPELLK